MIRHMYEARRNVWPDSAGHWTSADGEYAFTRTGNVWTATRLTEVGPGPIGTARTLTDALAMAGRHYVTPVGQWVPVTG